MSQLINFEKYKPNSDKGIFNSTADSSELLADSTVYPVEDMTKATIDLLSSKHPEKMLFNQEEASKILGMSYEFVNRKCRTGLIRTTKLGGKQLITIYELAKIINYGV